MFEKRKTTRELEISQLRWFAWKKYWMSSFGALVKTRDYRVWRVEKDHCWGSFENSKGRLSLCSGLVKPVKEDRIFEGSAVVHGNSRPSDNPKLAEPSNKPYRTVWSGYYWVLRLMNCFIRTWRIVRGTAKRWRWHFRRRCSDANGFLPNKDILLLLN